MCIYNFGYYSHEKSEYVQLYHKNKFSRQEFEEIVMTSATKIVDKENDKNLVFTNLFFL